MMDRQLRSHFNDATIGIRPDGWTRRCRGGFRNFIEEEVPTGSDAVEVVARILWFFCLREDGSFNDMIQGIQLAIKFIQNAPGVSLSGDETVRFAKDLKVLFAEPTDLQTIRQLVQSHLR